MSVPEFAVQWHGESFDLCWWYVARDAAPASGQAAVRGTSYDLSYEKLALPTKIFLNINKMLKKIT